MHPCLKSIASLALVAIAVLPGFAIAQDSRGQSTVALDTDQLPQDYYQSREAQTTRPSSTKAAGQVATSSVGVVGQRQEGYAADDGLQRPGRLNTRIANRVQSRIRNRIDRFYDPRANATSPFAVAADRAQQGR